MTDTTQHAGPVTSSELARLRWITAQLRRWCPWTAQLTHRELTNYLIEEAHEAVDAIETGDIAEIRDELGDVLFQVALHSALAETNPKPAQRFTIEDVAATINQKMIRRNPHVFTPEGQLQDPSVLGQSTVEDVEHAWEHIKQQEKADTTPDSTDESRAQAERVAHASIFSTPSGYPSLAAAAKILSRARRQEVNPLEETAGNTPNPPESIETEHQLGAQLFALVAQATQRGLDPERALREYLHWLEAQSAPSSAQRTVRVTP
ncbi:MazG nucleotide pyrophosphohydrolase domain-containing protein [Auritidibacter ignavus]|uniref:MazG nucleotide pyrophosphohydrolase domain-containing protein n=1 Tax=Auritidibacter ignavus TaxID=678932 RepID=UPI00244BD152|nr:MazG nucleotide pyrophosphohydrolase domain-containing protein [Auritidibacter ignavus]WGH84919.1 MazG nucleotide pyrophosphohydrolase domain-containing protein [Auritidibacter ignavus]WHS27329.1 MazG nucleotide pyrophosphohydrolase domain-containing protein [Auritidibacter ignavus]